ncbi:hypothetical protein FS837_009935 [Tulasnella sp. UAMH 9824]|nr:hypothetical protein FS837_009935 [Tulasnella sp. UAMH 9824]
MWVPSESLRLTSVPDRPLAIAVGSTLGGPSGQYQNKKSVKEDHMRQLASSMTESAEDLPDMLNDIQAIAKANPANVGNCAETLPFVHVSKRVITDELITVRSLALNLKTIKAYIQERGDSAGSITIADVHGFFVPACASCKELATRRGLSGEDYHPRVSYTPKGHGGFYLTYGAMKPAGRTV